IRSADGGEITEIDAMTDRTTYAKILSAMIDYNKRKYQLDQQRFIQIDQKITFENFVMWTYSRIEFPEQLITLNLFTDTFFDDQLSAFPSAIASRGRALWIIDWS